MPWPVSSLLTAGTALAAIAGSAGLGFGSAAGRAPAFAVETAPAAPASPIMRSADGLFYVYARVNGVPVRFLVDTGASVTVLNRRDARRAGVRGERAARLRTASGGSTMHWARMDRVSLAGQELHELDAALVGGDLPVSLLGQNVLTRIGSVAIVGNELHLG